MYKKSFKHTENKDLKLYNDVSTVLCSYFGDKE